MVAFKVPSLDQLLRGKMFVLSIGDEAVVVTLISGGKVANAWVASPDPAEGAADVLEALNTAKSVPVYVLMDAFEQVFREEKVPKVNFFDQKKVVERHLQMAFPGNNLQAAVSHGADPQGNKFFLFCSVPPTDLVKGWLSALDKAKRRPRGVHMLPLESLDMLDTLTPPAAQKGVRWRILFTFNMTGGLRQIVSKQGRITVARLTPPPPPDSAIDPVQIVERQFSETLAYVKRMGYQKGDNLDVVVLAEEPVAGAIRERAWEAHSMTVISPHEVGEVLGLGRIGQPGQPYADAVHALWFATRKKPKARMTWAQAPKVDYAHLVAQGAPIAAAAAVIALLAQGAVLGWDYTEALDAIDRQQRQLTLAQADLARERARLETLEFAAADIRPLIEVVEQLTAGHVPPVPLLARLGHALSGGAVITEMVMTTPQEAAPTNRRQRAQPGAESFVWRLGLSVTLPPDTTGDAHALERADVLEKALAATFADMRVAMLEAPVAVGSNQVVRGDRMMSSVSAAADPASPSRPEGLYTVRFEVVQEARS
ncbi:MAG: hypothetical protein VR70_12585 [Rhodospirillaceae bacterium BRH_c57]|nr:MAG: hypothetical protein VR70_12585 [Rhodospirillaceae bacterium BRH_c57]